MLRCMTREALQRCDTGDGGNRLGQAAATGKVILNEQRKIREGRWDLKHTTPPVPFNIVVQCDMMRPSTNCIMR